MTTVFTRTDLELAGMSRQRVRTLARSGRLRRVLHDVYAPADQPDTIELRVAACARVLRPHQVVVDRTAAWLHGVDALTWGEHDLPPRIEVCAVRGYEPARRRDIDSGERDLALGDIMDLHGVAVTTPTRTALDLGCRLRRREAYAALNELAREHQIPAARLRAGLDRFAGRRGVIQLRELLPLIDPRLESSREAWVWLAIHDAGLPPPTPQVWVGDGAFRLDFAYERLRVCVEYDGREAHGPEQAAYDTARREWLRSHGWRIVVVEVGDFTGDALDRWLRQLREFLRDSYDNRRW